MNHGLIRAYIRAFHQKRFSERSLMPHGTIEDRLGDNLPDPATFLLILK